MSGRLVDLNKFGVYENKDEYSYSGARSADGYIEKKYTFSLSVFGSANTSSQWYLTDETAKALLITYISNRWGDPAYYLGLPMDSIDFNLVDEYTWKASVTFANTDYSESDYQAEEPIESGETPTVGMQNIQFNFTSRQEHLLRSLDTVSTWYSGTAPIDFGGKVNVDSSGVCQGYDQLVPEMSFSITVNYGANAFTPSTFFDAIFSAVGCVNSDAWGIFASGTCLFLGADFSSQKYNSNALGVESRTDYWQGVFNYKYMGGQYLTTPSGTLWKDGQDLAWGYTEKGVLGEDLVQINVERVYPRVAFNTVFPWSWQIQ